MWCPRGLHRPEDEAFHGRAIELVHRLKDHAVLVISYSADDEGEEYERYLREYAALLGASTGSVSPSSSIVFDGLKRVSACSALLLRCLQPWARDPHACSTPCRISVNALIALTS